MAVDDRASFRGPASAYDRHVGRYSGALGRALIDFAGVPPAARVLDVGCGPGPLTAELVRTVGAASVAAVEPSPPYAEACRERLPGVDVRVAAAEDLPFPDADFDAVLSQLVVNFLTDAARGVGEMVRVCRPGGTVAAAVWDYAGEMTLLRAFWDAARELDPESAAGLDEGSRMRFATPEDLTGLWSQAGLVDVEGAPLVVAADYADFADLWAPFVAGVGPAGAYCAALDEPRQNRLRDLVRDRLAAPAGPFELTARAWAVRGRVASA